jgi:hypothetical protein
MFTNTWLDILNNTCAMDLGSDSFKLALFSNSATPDFSVASASTAYGAGVWATNEVTGTNWAAGGVALASNALTANSPAAGQVKWDATDVSEATVTVAAARCAFVYDDTLATPVADQGLLLIDFTADFSATAGTFAITFDANGLFYIDVVM